MDTLLRIMITFTAAFIACVCLPRDVFAEPVYAYPTPAGVIPTEVLGPYSPLPQQTSPSTVTSTGVAVRSTAMVPVVISNGRTVPVPVTATAQVSRLAIAKAVAKMFPVVREALALKELTDLLVQAMNYKLDAQGELQG